MPMREKMVGIAGSEGSGGKEGRGSGESIRARGCEKVAVGW